jgi:Flp pilus assembly pilin Flp
MDKIMSLIRVESDASTMDYALLTALLTLLLFRAATLIGNSISGNLHYVAAAHFIA